MRSSTSLEKAAAVVRQAKHITVLSGAGISEESGLRTFRGSGGLWEGVPVAEVATPEAFARDPQYVWAFYEARRLAALTAAPNPGHLALARMEVGRIMASKRKGGKSNGDGNGNGAGKTRNSPVVILTQNIDGLHQQAGNREVVELHGSVWKARCTQCGQVTSDFLVELPRLPRCQNCGGVLRPHVVWFGEPLEAAVVQKACASAENCDCFLVVGTSALVQPAATFPVMAHRRGIPLIEVNPEPTPLSEIATVVLRGKAGELLPQLV